MEPELRGLDFNPEPIECCIKRCINKAAFIVKYPPHPHYEDRWYPVCLPHVATSEQTPCVMCNGQMFTRKAIETL